MLLRPLRVPRYAYRRWVLGEARRIAAERRVPRGFRNRMERFAVIDLIYVLATFAFFALMVAYVRACQRLGRAPSDGDKSAREIS